MFLRTTLIATAIAASLLLAAPAPVLAQAKPKPAAATATTQGTPSKLVLDNSTRVLAALETRAKEHKYTPTVGRSHGIHAEPVTFGLKLAGYHAEFQRAKRRLITAKEEIATCAISGAVGTFANIDPAVEEHVCAQMGLTPEPISTQVIPRDRHAMFFATLGVIASAPSAVTNVSNPEVKGDSPNSSWNISGSRNGVAPVPTRKKNPP